MLLNDCLIFFQLEVFNKKVTKDDSSATIQAIMNYALGYRLGSEFTTFGGRGKRSFIERQLYLYVKNMLLVHNNS